MSTQAPDRPAVFLSYSRKDKRWLEDLRTMLAPLVRNGVVDVWWDGKIKPSQKWRAEIDAALASARIGVLLVSPHFLASDFIAENELPYLIEAAEQRGVVLFWVLLSECLHEQTPLGEIQATHDISRPLDTLEKAKRNGVLKSICQRIAEAAAPEPAPFGGAGVKPGASAPGGRAPQFPSPERATAGASPPSLWDSGEGGGDLRPGVEAPGFTPTSPAGTAPRLDLGRLPIAGPLLIGRESEMDRLDAAWDDPSTHVLTLVAFGGMGKSALVSHWLGSMAASEWCGARRVLDWSFYSQGTEERVTSADRFLDYALGFFGDPDPESGSPRDRGLRLAELVRRERTLLVLDGIEPLQHPTGPLAGRLKDPGLAALLKGLAAANTGLCVVTTRERIADLDSFPRTAPQENLEALSPEAGAELLHRLGVVGKKSELLAGSREFGNHALALTLLGGYLARAFGGDVRKRKEIDLAKANERQGGHALRVIGTYARWLGEGAALAILRLLGLFDRPAQPRALEALRAKPAIPGLTEPLVELGEEDWQLTVSTLREHGLLLPADPHKAGTLDAHPLVRIYFQEELEKDRPESWQAGNLRLYEHLRGEAPDQPDTLEAMEPLYTAVVHGCRAERQQEALYEVYLRRIQRGNEFYSTRKLGAMGSDLMALAGFFDKPWDRPLARLTAAAQAFVLNEAGVRLRALGRLVEAAEPMQVGLEALVAKRDWKNAAIQANNLGELTLTLGEVERSVTLGKQSIDLADRSGDAFYRMISRATLADSLHQAGRWEESAEVFREAEAMQAEGQPAYPRLYSLQGYRYCDLLLSQVEPEVGSGVGGLAADPEASRLLREACREVQERAEQTLDWAVKFLGLLDIALDHLSLGRTHFALALTDSSGAEAEVDFSQSTEHLDRAVDGLQQSGTEHHLPRGLLARAALRRFRGDLTGSEADLGEALEIAERGSMRLHECDAHLEWARLCRVRDEMEAAERHMAVARKLVEETGYGRRAREVTYPYTTT